MDKQPVGQLPDLTQSNNDDEIMVITNSEYNQLKKEKISDFITDLTSTNENNALTKGTDGKMFVTDFGNASNITEGTLPTSVLPEIPLEKIPDIPKDKLPPIETSDLPVSGVSADTYAYPSSVTVNAQGMVTAISEGTPSGANADTDLSNLTATGEKHFLNKTQLTNCILEAPNGVATYSGSDITIKSDLKYLSPNKRNADGTLKNIEYTVPSDETVNISSAPNGTYYLFKGNSTGVKYYVSTSDFYLQNEQPTIQTIGAIWENEKDNAIYITNNTGVSWEQLNGARIAKFVVYNGVVTSLTPYQPVELLKLTDKAEITGWGMPSNRYIDLTLGVTKSTYIAPANGWFFCISQASTNYSYEYIYVGCGFTPSITNYTYVLSDDIARASATSGKIAPVRKGDQIMIDYSSVSNRIFRFIYAEGN